MFWIGLAVGLFVGASLGIFVMCLLIEGARSEPPPPN